jgi:hypothetical protein
MFIIFQMPKILTRALYGVKACSLIPPLAASLSGLTSPDHSSEHWNGIPKARGWVAPNGAA